MGYGFTKYCVGSSNDCGLHGPAVDGLCPYGAEPAKYIGHVHVHLHMGLISLMEAMGVRSCGGQSTGSARASR
jgi:hypothetical protein